MALQLGSDCPFFIINKPCFAGGRGEFLEAIQLDLSPYRIVLVYPGIQISTAWAFSQIRPGKNENTISIREIIRRHPSDWKAALFNDFEQPVFERYPEIKKIKDQLYANGALYASLSGSGSAVFGLFENHQMQELNFQESYFVRVLPGKP
jgi:4-diphosphocytidyl-2-C-methyl-D-erythritol kinase